MPVGQRPNAPVLKVESGVGVLDGEALGVEGQEEGDEEVDQEGAEVLPGSVINMDIKIFFHKGSLC